MPNALKFSGTGHASVPGYDWPVGPGAGPGAVELYINTTSAGQALFTRSSRSAGGKTGGSAGLVVTIDVRGLIRVQDTVSLGDHSATTVYTTPVSAASAVVNDGKWHQVSLYSDGERFSLFVDGAAVALAPLSGEDEARRASLALALRMMERLSPAGVTTSIAFGADTFNATPAAPGYSGLMSELRVWKGGMPGWILRPAFSLNVGVPVAADTANLDLYWPFWTSQSAPLVDMVSRKTQLVLNGPYLVMNVPGQYYNDLSEVVCNGVMKPFDPFTAGTKRAAFGYIMAQAHLGFDPDTLRQQYRQETYADTLGTLFVLVSGTAFPGAGAPFTEADFNGVKAQLMAELRAVGVVWGFFRAAEKELEALDRQYTLAAGTVYATFLAGEIRLNTPPVESDFGAIVNAVATFVGFIPDVGKVLSGAIKGVWTVVAFKQDKPGATPDFRSSLTVQARAGDLVGAVNVAVQGMHRGLRSSLGVILGDGGLLGEVSRRMEIGKGFVFGESLDPANKELEHLNAVYNAAVLALSRVMLCGTTRLYFVPHNQYAQPLINCNWNVQAPLFAEIWPGGREYPAGIKPGTGSMFGGRMMVGNKSVGARGWPTFTTPGVLPEAMLLNAAAGLGLPFQQAEMMSWPFETQVVE